jgi:hypothetical protein
MVAVVLVLVHTNTDDASLQVARQRRGGVPGPGQNVLEACGVELDWCGIGYYCRCRILVYILLANTDLSS